MKRKERTENVLSILEKDNPKPKTELFYRNEYELTVAVILSAQCTDKRVNMVTPNLFLSFPSYKSLSEASQETIFEHIRSISYPNNKSKLLLSMANTIMNKYEGKLPKERDEMQKIAGIGRKTANVLASVLFQQPYIAVDTHVNRVSKRLGFVSENCKTPEAVEESLNTIIPDEKKADAHHWLILLGRYICTAKSPKCEKCLVPKYCKFFQKPQKSM